MSACQRDFADCQALAQRSPGALVDALSDHVAGMPATQQRALLAIKPERAALIKALTRQSKRDDAPLAGIPFMLQDLFDYDSHPTHCGAPFVEPFDSSADQSALLAQRLETWGACFFGKTVPSEFGWDNRGINRTYGTCFPAAHEATLPGGGAGSCAFAVASGLVPLALGLDSRAGVRIAAAFQGTYGYRMEHNAFAREGVFSVIPSLESVAAITATRLDLRQVIALFDSDDGNNSAGVPRGCLWLEGDVMVSPETRRGMAPLLRCFSIDEDPLADRVVRPSFQRAAQALSIIEHRELWHLHQYWVDEYREVYDPALLKRIEQGRRAYGPQTDEANEMQKALRAALFLLFQRYDFILAPVSPMGSPTAEEWDDSLERELEQLNAPLSLSMFPALIIPFRCEGGRHNAIQIIYNPDKPGLAQSLLKQAAGYHPVAD